MEQKLEIMISWSTEHMKILILYLLFSSSGILSIFHLRFIIIVTEEEEWSQKDSLILLTKTFWSIENFSPFMVSAFSLPLFFSLSIPFFAPFLQFQLLGVLDAGTLISSLWVSLQENCNWGGNQCAAVILATVLVPEDLVRIFYWIFATESYKILKAGNTPWSCLSLQELLHAVMWTWKSRLNPRFPQSN